MDLWLVALSLLLPILRLVLFPARRMGRGGNWTIVGALMIVGLMMALWFGVQQLTTATGDVAAVSAKASATDAAQSRDLAALDDLLK